MSNELISHILTNGDQVVISEIKGKQIFNAIAKDNGSGNLIKFLILETALIKGSKMSESYLDNLYPEDVFFLFETINVSIKKFII